MYVYFLSEKRKGGGETYFKGRGGNRDGKNGERQKRLRQKGKKKRNWFKTQYTHMHAHTHKRNVRDTKQK